MMMNRALVRFVGGFAILGLTLSPSGANAHVNEPPVARTRPLFLAVADVSCQVHLSANQLDDGSTDPDLTSGDTITLSLDKTTLTGIGDHAVTLTVTDSCGATSASVAAVRVAALASADLNPRRINAASMGQFVTAYLEFLSLCEGGAEDVDVSSVTLQVIDPVTSFRLPVAAGAPSGVGDGNGNDILDLMVKFDRASVESWFAYDTAARFILEGRFNNGTRFVAPDASARVQTGR